jgi:hypothetical protein
MRIRHLYLLLCVIGAILPFTQYVPFVLAQGWNLQIFFQQMLANRISIGFALDLVVAAIVFIIFIFAEGKRLGMRFVWLPLTVTLLIGLSSGFPLFLYMRQTHLERT